MEIGSLSALRTTKNGHQRTIRHRFSLDTVLCIVLDKLMGRITKRVEDKRLLKLIRAFLKAGDGELELSSNRLVRKVVFILISPYRA